MYVDPTSNTKASNLRWIVPYCRPDVPRVFAALVLFVVDKILIMLVPILAGMIVDLVIVDRHLDQLLPLCGARWWVRRLYAPAPATATRC